MNDVPWMTQSIPISLQSSSNVIDRLYARYDTGVEKIFAQSQLAEQKISNASFSPTLMNTGSIYHKSAVSYYTQNPDLDQQAIMEQLAIKMKYKQDECLNLVPEKPLKFKAIKTHPYCQYKLYDIQNTDFYGRLNLRDEQLIGQVKCVGNGNFKTGMQQIETTKLYLENRLKRIEKSKQKMDI